MIVFRRIKKFLKGSIPTDRQRDGVAYYNEGVRLTNLGINEDAVKAYDEAIRLFPDDVKAYYNKAKSLDALGRKEEL